VNLIDLDTWTPVALVAGLIATVSLTVGSGSMLGRLSLCAICVATNIRYVLWRSIYTIPEPDTLVATLWVDAFFAMELCSQLGALLISLFMSRTLNRSKEAESHQLSFLSSAPVDVFIATYNESREILERTIIGQRPSSIPTSGYGFSTTEPAQRSSSSPQSLKASTLFGSRVSTLRPAT